MLYMYLVLVIKYNHMNEAFAFSIDFFVDNVSYSPFWRSLLNARQVFHLYNSLTPFLNFFARIPTRWIVGNILEQLVTLSLGGFTLKLNGGQITKGWNSAPKTEIMTIMKRIALKKIKLAGGLTGWLSFHIILT